MRQKLDERVAADGKNTISYYGVKGDLLLPTLANSEIPTMPMTPKEAYIHK